MKTTNERYHVPALVRSLEVIDCLTKQGREGATLTEIMNTLGYPKNSIFRITTTLLDLGYLSRHPESQKFTLTKKFLAFGLHAISDENIIEQSMDIMRKLRDSTRAAAFIGVMNEGKGVMLEQAPGGYPFKLSIEPGSQFRMHCSAPGKAMLAFMRDDEAEPILKKMQFPGFTDTTITTLRAYRKELAEVKELGYALDRAEEFEGIHCVGAPIFDHTQRVIATLWISGSSSNLPSDTFPELGEKVKDAAARISVRLGYETSP
ncbi:IclR family transcriptional regulator [Verrucomicrobiaceae bacterium N1E253]|uniref:IclR family transcriptional regulator n=1 Tax=Oceaniferula marina TaxID=2748318 RepID=A0A851GL90_9BACT|nr:IclR family transcriptional regulator [Oceaniferula marina]NWK56601.1 IclR family transcriptional regulator [Oceaniferula marina]